MTFTLPSRRSTRSRMIAPVTLAIGAMLGSLFSAVPASAAPLVVPADPAAWAATPYSPLTWAQVPAAGNTANLSFDGEAGGLPDKADIGTGFTMVQPSSFAGTSPYYLPSNLTVADGKLTILTTKGIANIAVNSQDNTVGVGVDANNKALSLTTTMTSPAGANSSAQGGLWFGADDDNYIKFVVVGNTATGRQIQLAKEVAGASVPASTTPGKDQIFTQLAQSDFGTKSIKLDLLVDGVNKRVTGVYSIGTAAPVTLGTLGGLPNNFFDGSTIVPSADKPANVTSFAGLFATKRNIAEGTPLSFAFDNFGYSEVDVTPPTAPTGLTATSGDSKIDLAWQASSDADLAGYRVYRSATTPVATTGTPISGASPVAATTFTDVTTFGGTNYFYSVVAVDALGNISPAVEVGPAQSSVAAGEVIAKVDFTTPDGTAAAGYTKDDGSAYSVERGSGWENVAGEPTNISTETRVRGIAGADPRVDSIIHLQYKASTTGATAAESVWQYDVPNGTYTVVAAAGDSGAGISASGYDSQHTVRAEGTTVLERFQGSATRQFDEATTTGIVVSDGHLTIDAIGGTNSKLAYLEIYRTALTPVEPVAPAAPTGLTSAVDGTDVTVNWTATDGAVSYKVFRGATAAVDTSATPLGTVETTSFVDQTATAGNTYYYYVVATSANALDSSASASVEAVLPPVEVPVDPATCTASEWSVDYFAGVSLGGTPVVSECVVAIDQTSAPEGVGDTRYSARFTKVIDEGAGTYKFSATADDGVRVFVDGVAVIDEWRDQDGSTPYSASVTLTEGEHVVSVEYYQGWGGAKLKVGYYKASTGCVSSEWSVDYFAGVSLAGAPVVSECVVAIDQTSAPEGVGDTRYSARFTKVIDEGAGTYVFAARSDDGVRVFVDGVAMIDEWHDQDGSTPHSASVTLTDGQHVVSVEYYQGWSGAKLKVGYYKASTGCVSSEWSVDYFAGVSLAGAPVVSECVVAIDQTSAPEGVGDTRYSARFTKVIDEGAGTYKFAARSDDGVRVFVDNVAVIDEWHDQDGSSTHTASVTLTEGQHVVSVEYYQGWSGAKLKVDYVHEAEAQCTASQWSVDYFSGTALAGLPLESVCVTDIDQTSAPSGVGTELYSARFNKVVDEGAGTYVFEVLSDDGVRVFVDGVAVIDEWYGQDGTNLHTASVTLTSGQHVVTVEYYQGWGAAKLKVDYAKAGTDVTAPTAVTELVATQAEQSIRLQWAASSSSDVAGYRVYRGTAAGVSASGAPVSGSTLLTAATFDDSTIVHGTTYYYVVTAVDTAGNESVVSNETMGVFADAPDTAAPEAPTALVAVGGNDSIALSWGASASDDTIGYKVYRGTEAGAVTGGELISGAAPLTGSSYTDDTVVSGTTYYYAVTAIDLAGNESVSSNEAQIKAQLNIPANPADWAATPYSPLTWPQVPAAGNAANFTFNGSEGGLPDASGLGTGFTMVQPSSAAATSPYYVPGNLSVAAGALKITTSKGIASAAVNTQDNALGLGVAAQNKSFVLTTTLASPAAAASFAQGGIWFGPDDKNYAKLALIGNGTTGDRQIQLYKEINDVSASPSGTATPGNPTRSADQIIVATTQTALGSAPITLKLQMDGINKTMTASYQVGSGAVISVGTLTGVPASFFDGSLIATTKPTANAVTSFAGLYATKRNMSDTTPLVYSFDSFSLAEVDVTPPAAPAGVSATASQSSIDLAWQASADAVGYHVYRGTTVNVDVTGTSFSGSVPLTDPAFKDLSAEAGVTYYYVVTAVDASGNKSAASAAVQGMVPVVEDPNALSPATALTATSADSSVTLAWTASRSSSVVGYRVYRGAEPAVSPTGTPISGASAVTGTTWVDTSVTDGTTYFYIVVAVNLAGTASPASNEVVATPRVPNTTNVKVDFTETNGVPFTGYVADWGQAFDVRTGATQGNGALSYGWMDPDGHSVSLVTNGRDRGRTGVPDLLDSIIHMQYGDVSGGTGTNGVKTEGVWEMAVPDGLYSVKLAVGDQPDAKTGYDSNNVINVEGTVGAESFVGTAATEYKTIETKVGVWDGKLTIEAKGGINTKIAYVDVLGLPFTAHVDTVLPENRVTGHDVGAGVSATIKIPYAGIGVNPLTLPGNVHLYEVSTGAEISSTSGSSGGNDVISLAPDAPLKANTAYRFQVTSGVKDNYGVAFAPFTSLFTTGSGIITSSGEFTPAKNIAFEKIELPTGQGKYWASFAFGPDGMLYGSTIGEGIFRFPVNADGTLGVPESLGYEGTSIIGLLFDKSATAGDLRLWITSTTANFSEQGQWVSSVHQLSGPNLATDRTIFSSLPRSLSDHLTNSMAYGPDGRIYFQQGANTASGDLDSAWGQRGEQLLTAATLVFNPADAAVSTAANGGGAIDVKTAQGGTYDPYKANAPLKIYATGIRNAYDLVWHSNGHLYVSTNGTAGGANTPGVTANADGTFTRKAAAGIPGFDTVNNRDVTAQCVRRGYTGGTVPPEGNIKTQKDLMFDVVEGGYYGHPNPERCEFVLNAGNDAATPTAPGTSESKYPIGTKADPNYRGVAFDYEFNKSPNGALEYKSSAFGGQLKGRVVVTRFSNNNDLIFLQPDAATGKILGAQLSVGITGVPDTTMSGVDGFNDPLEVVENVKNGNLYVNQYDRSGSDQRLYLLRVPASQQATTVSTSANELVFSTVKSTTSPSKTMKVTNNSAQAATINTSLVGAQTGEFTVTGGNVSVPAKGSITLTVNFKPGTTVGQRSTTLHIVSGQSSVDVGLYGLAMQGIEGLNEPTLNDVLGTAGYKLNVGWTNLEGGVQPTAKGDEILEPLFVKSGTAAPTMTPIAQYAPREDLPFGWYTGDGAAATRHQIGSIDISGYQSLLPPTSAGSASSFDPGTGTFGLYYYSNKFGRFGYTEDRLNTDTPHRARIYPAKNRAGTLMSNTYIVAFEDASNGDFQDYLFVVTGIKPVTSTGSLDGAVRVDFTTKIGGLATGYLRDYGQAFGSRTAADQGSGLTFGWKNSTTENDVDLSTGGTTNVGNGRDRATSQTDQRLDSFMHMQTATLPKFNGNPVDAYWEIAVPNGQYTVTVAVGDPAPQSDPEVHQINLEDAELIHLFTPAGAAGTATRHETETKTVTVADGFLTVDARGGTNTKISYIDIVPVTGGDTTGDDPTDGAQVKVNFQTPASPTPAGWTADIGAAYSATTGSGWTDPATGSPVDRTASNRYRTAATAGIAFPSDVLLQSFAFLQTNPAPAVWEYAVPNGTYEVAVSVGDAGFLDSVHRVTAEDQPVVADFTPTGATPFQTGKRTVTVTDGRMTIAGTGTNTKIDWVSIKGAGLDGPPVEVIPSVKVNFQPDTVAVPAGWTADTGAGFSPERGYGWLVAGQPGDKSIGTRYRNAPTSGFAYPTGDVTRQTFMITQYMANGPAGVVDGVWEYSVANGTYDVSVSVGDSAYVDSIHGVDVEGTSILSGFVPTKTAPFKTGTAEVTVTDGLLTLTPTGENTKVDWITITGANLAAPAVAVTVNGAPVGTTFDGGTASVQLDATASGASTISSLTWSLDGGTPAAYTAPIVVDQVGTKVLTVTATDSEGRVTTRVVTLTIENIGGTLALHNDQATRVNGAVIPGFYEDWLVMSRINDGVILHKFVEQATVTVSNNGIKPLRISKLALAGTNATQFELVDAPTMPVTVAPGASTPITVHFIANTGSRGVRSAQLNITSSDTAHAVTTVQLRGGYMVQPEGGSELRLSEIGALYGWTTNIGALANGDEMRDAPLNGEEVRSLLWKRANASLPVVARQLAAFHGCCDATETININGAKSTHAAPYGQSILPPTTAGTPTQVSTNPTANFGIIIGGQTTNQPAYMSMKTWPVRDRNGSIVAGAFIVGQDYISTPNQCGIAPTNCDFQDNVYLLTNVLPVASTDVTAPEAPVATTAAVTGTSVTVGWTASTATDVGGYVVERATAAAGPWTRVSGAALVTGTTWVDSSLPFAASAFYRVTAVDASGNASLPSAAAEVNISGLSAQSIRINAGGPAVTTDSGSWLADTYFTGGKTYTNGSVTQIAGTTDDAVYRTERSLATPFGYDVPLPAGTYTVKLHFAEIYFGATGGGTGGTGKRVFDVNLEGGTKEVVGLDLNAKVAPMTAYVTTNTVTVTDGNLDIDFTSTVNESKISAIEIIRSN